MSDAGWARTLAGAVMAATHAEVEFVGPDYRRQIDERRALEAERAERNARHRTGAWAAAEAKRARKNAKRLTPPSQPGL
jgi:sRNA-binding protein